MRYPRWPAIAIAVLGFGCATAAVIPDEDSGVPIDSGGKPDGVAPCPGAQTRCGATCTDPTKDVNNCGKCGTKCTVGQYCATSKCNDDCVPPNQVCGQFCLDTTTDHDNCGGCSKPCAADQECKNKACIKKCAKGLSVCGNDCADLTSDPGFCGDCNVACSMGEVCTASLCCKTGQVACNGACTDTLGDPDNCGSCGFACGGNTPYCTNGKCDVLTHGTSQLAFDYTSSGGCGDMSVWRTQNFGQMTYDACEKLANQYGAQYVGAPSLYSYTAPYASYVRWVGEQSASNAYVSTGGWNIVSSVSKATQHYCVLGYANGTQHGTTTFVQVMQSTNGRFYALKDFGVISELTCYSNARDAGARPLNPQMFGLVLGVTHMVENHSCHGSVEYNAGSYSADGGASHNYRCLLGYN